MIAGPILAGICLLAPLGAAHAEMKIAVVNVPRLLDEAPQAKSAMQALQDEFAPRQKEIMAQQKDLKAKEDKLNRDGAVMAENERRNAEKDLRDGQRELARKQNEYVEDPNLRRNEEIGKLQRSLLQEVQAFARTSSYDFDRRRGRPLRERVDGHHRAGADRAPGPLQGHWRRYAETCSTPKAATPPAPTSKPPQ
jgi:outer membrane protein